MFCTIIEFFCNLRSFKEEQHCGESKAVAQGRQRQHRGASQQVQGDFEGQGGEDQDVRGTAQYQSE